MSEIFKTGIDAPVNCGRKMLFSLDYTENGEVITPEGVNGQLVKDNPQCNIPGFTILQAEGGKIRCREYNTCRFCRR